MSSGKEHLAANRGGMLTLPIGFALAYLGFLPAVAVWAGMFIGQIIEPDLDQKNITLTEARMPRLIRPFFVAWWLPYANLFSHRGISHAPIMGTVTRILWALPIHIILFMAIGEWIVWVWAGIAWSDILHWFLDGCPVLTKGHYTD